MKCMYCGTELTTVDGMGYVCQSCKNRLGLDITFGNITITKNLTFTEIEEAHKVLKAEINNEV